jgi:ParB family chromosome partitioning protein
MTQVHYLKCWPEPFEATLAGLKTHEFRKNDRDFKVGDLLVLQLFDPETQTYVGLKECTVRVTYASYGPDWRIPEGYVVMSIEPK